MPVHLPVRCPKTQAPPACNSAISLTYRALLPMRPRLWQARGPTARSAEPLLGLRSRTQLHQLGCLRHLLPRIHHGREKSSGARGSASERRRSLRLIRRILRSSFGDGGAYSKGLRDTVA